MSTILVSAANRSYFHLLQGLTRSVQACKEGRDIALGVLDLGLTAEQRSWVEDRYDRVVEPGWDIDFPNKSSLGDGFRAMTSRPFLPEHFPEFDYLLWFDADAWVQKGETIRHYRTAAADGALAITPEVSRCYRSTFDTGHTTGMYTSYKGVFGKDVAQECGFNPVLNSGAFCAHRAAPVWKHWRERLTEALQDVQDYYIEQFSLNVAVYMSDDVDTHFLPETCNWMCHQATPFFNPATGLYVEPLQPHREIGLVHLTVNQKKRKHTIQTTDGRAFKTSLMYSDGVHDELQPALTTS